jgi:hypothetical protein
MGAVVLSVVVVAVLPSRLQEMDKMATKAKTKVIAILIFSNFMQR